MRAGSPLESLHTALADARHRFGLEDQAAFDKNVDVTLWQQTWSNTSCGHGGMAGQALTRCDMVAVHLNGVLLIYSAGRLLHEADAHAEDSSAYEALVQAVKLGEVPAKNGRG